MKAGGNARCFRAFRAAKIPMAVTDGGGRNSLENSLEDFRERYHHAGAKAYKYALQKEVSAETESEGTGKASASSGATELSPADLERIQTLARLDPDIPWHLPIPFVVYKLLLLSIRIVFGFPALPLLVVFFLARFFLFPQNALLQGLGWMLAVLPAIGAFLFGRKLCRDFTQGRIPPFKSAQNLLAEKLNEGRAIRTPGYDVFLPDPNREAKTSTKKDGDDGDGDDDNQQIGLMLYPGWLINHTAYAPIASKLSDAGILVVVMSMEPFRASVESTQRETQRALQVMYELLADVASNHPVSEWAVGGHAVGGHLAMKVARATSPGTSKLVLWGCGSRPLDYRSCSLADNSSIDVLVLNGSEDRSVNQLSFVQKTDFRAALPPSAEHRTIRGGNHNGFGHYEKPKNKKKDGIRTITLDEQQDITVDATVQFLKNGTKSKLPDSHQAALDSAVVATSSKESSKKNE
mmetsp:Transcript_19236/g.53620  ORF Transcript_19236/g.53620 Transcript_19236/m.53620 type:complete len:464 (-) Transcript_19236:349-1740(-)